MSNREKTPFSIHSALKREKKLPAWARVVTIAFAAYTLAQKPSFLNNWRKPFEAY